MHMTSLTIHIEIVAMVIMRVMAVTVIRYVDLRGESQMMGWTRYEPKMGVGCLMHDD